MTPLATLAFGIPWKKMWLGILKAEFWLLALLKPLGAWGILGLAMIDSASVPLPFLDPLIVTYGVDHHAGVILYCLMGAIGSGIGCMFTYYVGRAGGEIFLLKRINRQRYERLRDRFEKQEFLAIMLPAMCPPPTPLKLFELAAGVFEMRPLSFFLAIVTGKFIRFLIESILVIIYGPAILANSLRFVRMHSGFTLGLVGAVIFGILFYILRKVFDRRRGTTLPVEETGLEVSSDDTL